MARETQAFLWTGDAFVPTARFVTAAQEKFVPGAAYWLSVEPERSEKTHNHEFGFIATAWKNLPDHLAEHFPTAEHLRKRALIDAGYYTETILDVGSNAAALRVRAYAQAEDEFAVVVVRGPVVVVRKAKSQSRRAMGAGQFHASKQAVLEIVAGLIGVTPDALAQTREAA